MKIRGREMAQALISAGISYSRDGLLLVMLTRGQYKESLKTAKQAIARREHDLAALRTLVDELEEYESLPSNL